MPVQVVCPKCKKAMPYDGAAGKVSCPTCGGSFRVSPSTGEAKRSTVGPSAGSRADHPAAGGPGAAPESIGAYEVRQTLGRGAFGVVYRAHDPQLGRDVAIKVLNRDALASTKAVERFLREARVVAQMHHNHIVPVFMLGEQDGAHYIVSKFISGQALSEAVPEDGMDPARAIVLVIQLLEALAYAHDMDVLHRDVKPANAILDANGQLYLMDFGLAGWVGHESGRMTQDGAVLGTPSYMAPEQARGDVRAVGPAADQYSAGMVLYELLTGHLAFEGGPTEVVLYNILNSAPPPPSQWREDLDPALEEICLKAMAKRPEERYASCRDFADALRRWQARGSEAPAEFVPVDDDEPAAPEFVPVIPASPSGVRRPKGRSGAYAAPRGGEGAEEMPVWHYTDARGKKVGPVTRDRLLALYREGEIEAKTPVWNPALPRWVPLKSVPGLLPVGARSKKRGGVGSGNGLAVASLVLSVLWLCGLGSAFGVLLGVMALRGAKGQKGGRGLALAGIAVGVVGLALTACAGIVAYWPPIGSVTHSPDRIAGEYQDRVYRVEHTGEKGSVQGSGVLLANDGRRGLIATSVTVIAPELADKLEGKMARKLLSDNSLAKGMTADVQPPSQLQVKKASVAALHKDLDVALLLVDLDGARPGHLAVARQDGIHDGEKAVAMGYQMGKQLTTTPGVISNHRGELGLVWTNCPTGPGSSGGPLFLERRGLLAGFNVGSFERGQNVNGAAPADQVITDLQNGRGDGWLWQAELRE
ncbi:MAG TPA: protein kinase, partial [Gemmataceae bacterium]|nr:protein kinase [Gemmataceae bacterium]